MKKLGLFLVMAVTLMVTSCTSLESRLEGKWNYTFTFDLDPSNPETGTIEFKEDGTGTMDDDASDSFTWSVEDETLTIISDGENIVFENTKNEKDEQSFTFDLGSGFTGTMDLTK